MTTPDGYRVASVGPRPIKVHTMKGVQHHRGHQAIVYPPDGATPIRCGDIHKTARAAVACGERIARMTARGEPWAWGPRHEWKKAQRGD